MSKEVNDFYAAYEALIAAANEVNLAVFQHDAILNLGRTIGYDAWKFERENPDLSRGADSW